MSHEYDPKKIEKKWQEEWERGKLYVTPDSKEGKENEYILVEFAYPSGNLHAGHWYAFSVMDIYARYRKMLGKNVMFPFGFDSFGLPAENAAIKRGLNPRDWTYDNIAHMRKQMASMGTMFDWSREVVTSDPEYYKWTQWLFLKLFEKNLAYRKETPVNWCPNDKTVLANEQVVDGKCERCGAEVEQKNMLQWNLKITDYADRLIEDLGTLDWPEAIKESQKNWIGRSEGAIVKFDDYEIFTTRPDTIYGATYLAISGKEDKFTGKYVTNPATKEKIPVWEAEYVMSDYGTGAVMGVPSEDERDKIFAEKHSLPIMSIDSYPRAGLEDFGKKVTKYKLRDWVVSRQRYWGCPIPIIHCEKCGAVPVPENDLPVKLPEIDDFLPTGDGKSPLAKAQAWVETKCPKCDGEAKRETDTLDTFVDSSWYFLRYADSENNKEFASKDKLNKWIPVDFYSGGAEHTTMHLLYSRFFHKALFDLGLVNENEPYVRRMNRGLILGPDGNKMSKSKGNVIDPDDYVSRLGADTVRTYLAFIGPYNEVGYYPWNPDSIVGVRRFLERVWKLKDKKIVEDRDGVEYERNKTIKTVTDSLHSLKLNTGVAGLMMYVNTLSNYPEITKKEYETLLKLLSPFSPHIVEEIWAILGHKNSIHVELWPTYDQSALIEDRVTVAVQVNGKVRATLEISHELDEEEARKLALNLPEIEKWISGKKLVNFIYKPGKVINIVVNA